MSGVRTEDRKASSVEFMNSAHELEKLTIQLSMRENAIPKRYRFILGQPLCEAARTLNRSITYANAIYPTNRKEYEIRRSYQTKAKMALSDMFEIMRLATELLPMKNTVVNEWTKIASIEQKALLSWMQSDKSRYKDLP
ncbi:hypothetical protein [Butyrivibrio proteoclasticus]|uniref:hypothetical protein n=1 Tax=Butyrivibrio proteoclasticus TaxID=43305 RepID=UPI000478D65F|nr:hypothetical protein [Butyrivibrio proteoclasticus]